MTKRKNAYIIITLVATILLQSLVFTPVVSAKKSEHKCDKQQKCLEPSKCYKFGHKSDKNKKNSQNEYVNKLFNKNKIVKIEINAEESEWKNMLDNATDEEFIRCNVTINGKKFEDVGIRPKGNSSLFMLASSDSDRFSFKFDFDKYVKNQTCFGLEKFVINNMTADSTYMKEYLSYDIMSYMGVPTPLYSFASITVNGKPWGFYLAVETIEEDFAERNFGKNYGMLYKPETDNMKFQSIPIFPGNTTEPAISIAPNVTVPPMPFNPATTPAAIETGGIPSFGGGDFSPFGGPAAGADLKYIDDNISSYKSIFENEVFDGTDEDYARVIKALKNLSNGTDLKKYIDVDEVLRYSAAQTVVVNLDSYFSMMRHNYYLYEKNGKLSILPWDYNLSFGGFNNDASSAVNFPIDTPVSGVQLSDCPILSKLLEVDKYKQKYHMYLKKIVDEYFGKRNFQNKVDSLDKLISNYVKNDATAFVTYDEYNKAVQMLKEYGKLRAKSIIGQLNGTIPSTTEGQKADSSKLIDASSIDLKVLGSQMQGGFSGGSGMMPDDMPSFEIMSQAIDIMKEANGQPLNEEQLARLKALNLTDEQITFILDMFNQFQK